MSAELIKSLSAEIGKVVTDDDGTEVCITTDMIQKAIAAKARLDMGVYITSMSLKELKDNRLYLSFGYKGWIEFIENELPYSVRTVQDHLLIANNLFSLAEPADPNDPLSISENAQHAASLSKRTLLQLCKFKEEDRVRLIADGFIRLGDKDYSIDELKKVISKEISTKLTEVSPKIAKNAELERENDLLRTVNSTQKEKLDKAETQLKKYEKLVGDDKKSQIMRDIRYFWNQIGAQSKDFQKQEPTTEETEAVIEFLKECIIDANTMIEKLQSAID